MPLLSPIHALLLTFLLPSLIFAADPSSLPPQTPTYRPNTTDLYGLGVRLGIYFQLLSFLLGYWNLLRLEVKSQFAGLVLAYTFLIRFFSRVHDEDISVPEMWVVIALLLSFTIPGIWLLRCVFVTQRRRLVGRVGREAAKRQIVEGQGLNIILTVVSTFGVLVANSWFAFGLVKHSKSTDAKFPDVKEVIWAFSANAVDSGYIQSFLAAQAGLSWVSIYPAIKYLVLWGKSVYYWWYPTDDPDEPVHETKREALNAAFTRWGLHMKRSYILFSIMFAAYSGCLIASVEKTILVAGLTPEMNVLAPGQLIPLLTGLIAFMSAAADLVRRRGPNEIAPWDLDERDILPVVGDRIPLTRMKRWDDE
jgi:hypothetical protein